MRWLRIWAFATSPYGLAVSEPDFWALTPRLYAHLRERWKESRMLFASLQATLHKAHFTGDWEPAMFMPGYRPVAQDWKQQKAMAQMISGGLKTTMTPEETRATNEGAELFRARSKRAQEAKGRGEDPAKVRAIMDGVM